MLANAATMRILIKGGKVVNDDCTLEADVYIENGIIQQVGRELMIPGGAKVIDATGKLVIPGGIDTSTHFHQTFMNATCVDDFYHGTKAALVGGTTMIIGHVLPDKETSLLDAYEKCRSLADPKVCCDYALHMGITWWAPKVNVAAHPGECARTAGAHAWAHTRRHGPRAGSRHALPSCKEARARAAARGAATGACVARRHVCMRVCTAGPRSQRGRGDAATRAHTCRAACSAPLAPAGLHTPLARPLPPPARTHARASVPAGKVVYAETTTAHATLTGLHYYHQDWFHAAAYVTVPPLRLDTNTSAYLMSLLANDTLNVVASDHRPFSPKQKAMGKEDFTKIPHGVSGVQDRMNIIWERGVV
ncbi:DPYL5 protein, partial [Dromaius novaehollandiae]|nr:DPYL5 protein [Dromaius novaehollandiae]